MPVTFDLWPVLRVTCKLLQVGGSCLGVPGRPEGSPTLGVVSAVGGLDGRIVGLMTGGEGEDRLVGVFAFSFLTKLRERQRQTIINENHNRCIITNATTP